MQYDVGMMYFIFKGYCTIKKQQIYMLLCISATIVLFKVPVCLSIPPCLKFRFA